MEFVSASTMFDSRITEVRDTVVIVLAGPRRGRARAVCLVQPRGDCTGNTLVLPQGGIRRGETLAHAAFRELCEELSIDSSSLTFEEYLGSVDNPIPQGRQKDGVHTKRLHFVLVTTTASRLALNPESIENINVMWAYGFPALVGLMADVENRRPLKYGATLAAVTAARVWPNQHLEIAAAAD